MIRTERLSIRRICADDWRAIQKIWTDAVKSVYAQYDKPNALDDEAVFCRIAKWAATADGDEHMLFAICLNAVVIGYVVFNLRDDAYEIGYCFHSDYHGKGYARESVSALLDMMKAKGISRIAAGTALKNTPSVKLLLSLGFKQIGMEKVSFYKDDNGNDIFFEGGEYELNLF